MYSMAHLARTNLDTYRKCLHIGSSKFVSFHSKLISKVSSTLILSILFLLQSFVSRRVEVSRRVVYINPETLYNLLLLCHYVASVSYLESKIVMI